MDINIELMASELRPEYAGPTSVRLQSGNGFDVTLVGTQEEIFDAWEPDRLTSWSRLRPVSYR